MSYGSARFRVTFIRYDHDDNLYTYAFGPTEWDPLSIHAKGAEAVRRYELDGPYGRELSRPLVDFVNSLSGKQPEEIKWPDKLTDLLPAEGS